MSTLAIMLQMWPGDCEQAIELSQLIADIEPQIRTDIEFVIAVRRDVTEDVPRIIQNIVRKKFARVEIIRTQRYGQGFPEGCNDLWQDASMQIGELKTYGKLKADAFLSFEPDCSPLRADWLNILKAAWDTADQMKFDGCGSLCSPTDPWEHINGNAIFRIDMLRRYPELCSSRGNWDIWHRKLLLRTMQPTTAIEQLYGYKEDVKREYIEDTRNKFRAPALLHGVKNGSVRAVIRAMMENGSFWQPIIPTVAPAPKFEGKVKFSISILAMNNLALTERCIESVLANSTQSFELLLWDNGSKEHILDYFNSLRGLGGNVTVTHVDENIGFTDPNNHHLDLAQGQYFICLNNDATVPPGWLEKLEQPFLEHRSAAISGAIGCCELNDNFHGRPGKVIEYIEGSCLCIRTDLAKQHGLFSDYIHFAYGEDCDLSLRMRALGYTLHQSPFQIVHQRSSTAKNIANIREIQQRNHGELQKRWGHYLKVRRLDYPIIVKRKGAIGDALLICAVLRQLHAIHPLSKIFVETDYPELFRGNGSIEGAAKSYPHNDEARVIDLNMAYENRPMVNYVEAYHDVAGTKSDGDDTPEILANSEDNSWAAHYLNVGDPKNWCAIHATPTAWHGRNWPAERIQNVCDWLMAHNWNIVLVGAGKDQGIDAHVNLINKTTVHQLAAVLDVCSLFVGHDSFPMHCAMAVGCPVIGLFGMSYGKVVVPAGAIAKIIDADPQHPFAGARSKSMGVTFIECDNNPMETIDTNKVIQAIQDIT